MKKRDIGKSKEYKIPNLIKAFEMMEIISASRGGLTFPQLLEKIDCNKTSLFRIILSLEKIGYLRKNKETDAYTITKKILPLAYSSLCDANLIEEATPIMRKLRDSTGETTMLGAFLNNECVMLSQESGVHSFNFMGKLGMTSPLHASAPGKALLSVLSESERIAALGTKPLTKCADKTITDKKKLIAKLNTYAANAFATDESEAVDGVNCVASAIFNAHKSPVAVIWITAPSSRINKSNFAKLGELTKNAAAEISSRLGYENA